MYSIIKHCILIFTTHANQTNKAKFKRVFGNNNPLVFSQYKEMQHNSFWELLSSLKHKIRTKHHGKNKNLKIKTCLKRVTNLRTCWKTQKNGVTFCNELPRHRWGKSPWFDPPSSGKHTWTHPLTRLCLRSPSTVP